MRTWWVAIFCYLGCYLWCGDSGEYLKFIDDLSLPRRNVSSKWMRRCDISHLTLKGWYDTRLHCAMHVKKHLPQWYDRTPGDPLFATIQMRCPATLQSSHCYQLELQAKKAAAYGLKCDQCVCLIMLSFPSWVPETTFVCVNVFINRSYSSCWVVARVLYHIGFRRKDWTLSGKRDELHFQY